MTLIHLISKCISHRGDSGKADEVRCLSSEAMNLHRHLTFAFEQDAKQPLNALRLIGDGDRYTGTLASSGFSSSDQVLVRNTVLSKVGIGDIECHTLTPAEIREYQYSKYKDQYPSVCTIRIPTRAYHNYRSAECGNGFEGMSRRF